ncbi:MAG: hypothetical protein AB8B62_14255 [Roseobacter sp.]
MSSAVFAFVISAIGFAIRPSRMPVPGARAVMTVWIGGHPNL